MIYLARVMSVLAVYFDRYSYLSIINYIESSQRQRIKQVLSIRVLILKYLIRRTACPRRK